MSASKLSLVAQFDDLVRNRSVLTAGIETEFWKFVSNQENCRKRWLEADGSYADLKDRIGSLELEKTTLDTKLKHARNHIDQEIKKRKRAEMERDSLERQVALVRELLTDKNQSALNEHDREKLAFLSTDFAQRGPYDQSPHRLGLGTIDESLSVLSPSDISYDKTEEDLDESYLRSGKKWKHPSAPPHYEDDTASPTHLKKSRHSSQKQRRKHRRSKSAVIATSTVTVEDGTIDASTEIITDPRKRHLSATPIKPMKKFHSDGNVSVDRIDDTMGSPITTPPNVDRHLRHYGSGNKLSKPHIFVSKTVIKPESCNPCGKRVKFGKVAMKCKDCRATAHPECKERVPLPCIPATITPGNSKLAAGLLSDYTGSELPMIPAIVIHCVNEIESRGLGEVGIYRVPGSEREVKELKEKFLRGKGTPNLSHVDDIHVVCGCLKDFLRGLKEPLVTYSLWARFVNSAETVDSDESLSLTYQVVSELPQPNRDTMAFIILHLQRVSECNECKMPANNLAKVFGPTVVGYSVSEPEPMQMINETRKQQMVMERLMSISADYWTRFINIEDTVFPMEHGTPQTPEVPHSMLGPVHDTENADKKSWFTPRFGSKSRHPTKKPTSFFSSPMLK